MPLWSAGRGARYVACYLELPRITIPRTRVNRGKKKGRGCYVPAPPALSYVQHRIRAEEPQ
jgi:hypothetical protein